MRMNKREIKRLAKDEMYSCLICYVVSDSTVENLTDEEREVFFDEFEKIVNRLKKIV